MTRRQTLVALALVAAMAIAVPSIAAVDDGINFKRLSIQARKTSKKALKKANRALKKANQPGPQGPTGPAGGGGGTTAFAQVAGAFTTSNENDYDPGGGPAVSVNVPSSGTIQVAAQAFIGDEAGAVSLYEDGAQMPGQADLCGQIFAPLPGGPLFVSMDQFIPGGGTWSTPAVLDAITGQCGNTGPAGPVMFQTTPGNHTYELRYGYCGCSGTDATFSERKLWVTTLP